MALALALGVFVEGDDAIELLGRGGAAEGTEPELPSELAGARGLAEGGRVAVEVAARRRGAGLEGLRGEAACGRVVLLHEQVADRQDRAVVVEAVAGLVVLGELVGRAARGAEQVADGVVVFDPVEPPEGHVTGCERGLLTEGGVGGVGDRVAGPAGGLAGIPDESVAARDERHGGEQGPEAAMGGERHARQKSRIHSATLGKRGMKRQGFWPMRRSAPCSPER